MAGKKNSNKRNTQKAVRAAEQAAKKNPKVFIAVVAILLVIILVAVLLWYFLIYKKKGNTDVLSGDEKEIATADFSIHFLELGCEYVGDCVLIKSGNTEVLIDAGAKSRAPGIKAEELAPTQAMLDYVAKYCTDGTLEYVIATHAHQDHIAGLVGDESSNARKGFLYQYKIGTIIQFAGHKTESGIYNRYVEAVNYCKERGTKVYTALDCTEGANGAQATYYLNEAQTLSMRILYQKYYRETTSNENNYSVCTLLTYKAENAEQNYLFTGDLEKAGEESLVESNPDLPHCVLYKGGHHGSATSSNDVLLKKITPENVAICTCAGTYEYAESDATTFPTQETVDRLGKYTDKIYVTSLGVLDDGNETTGFVSMNGNIVFYYGGGEAGDKSLKLWCSNNTTILKDTEWFKAHRTWNGGT